MEGIISKLILNLWLFINSVLILYLNILKKLKIIDKRNAKFLQAYPLMSNIVNELNSFYLKITAYELSYFSRKHNNWLDKKELTYGETYLFSIPKIINEIDITSDDIFYELGCGTGYVSFFVRQYTSAKLVIGIDVIKEFIKIANIVVKKLNLKNIQFYNNDFLEMDISNGTIFYLTLTCYDSDLIKKLESKLELLPKGIKIICISRKLTSPNFKLIHHKTALFSWSLDEVYFYEKIS